MLQRSSRPETWLLGAHYSSHKRFNPSGQTCQHPCSTCLPIYTRRRTYRFSRYYIIWTEATSIVGVCSGSKVLRYIRFWRKRNLNDTGLLNPKSSKIDIFFFFCKILVVYCVRNQSHVWGFFIRYLVKQFLFYSLQISFWEGHVLSSPKLEEFSGKKSGSPSVVARVQGSSRSHGCGGCMPLRPKRARCGMYVGFFRNFSSRASFRFGLMSQNI